MHAARWFLTRSIVGLAAVTFVTIAFTNPLYAQGATGTVAGLVTDTAGKPVSDALVHVVGTKLGTQTGVDGAFSIADVPAGPHRLAVTTQTGYFPDTSNVTVTAGQKTDVVVRLSFGAKIQHLGPVVVTAKRLGTTEAAALEEQQNATNWLNVLAGDEIRALPNYNAAEAAGRIPGVSLERDEGEGKYVQVRGTDPRLTNVTINGAEVPGTLPGERVAKLDDVPSDVLGAINVSKTLTADMPADAIGGTVDLQTKTPEDAPRGYISGQYGDIQLLSRNSGQAGFTYGGRFGPDKKLGFLLGGSWDHTGRSINDVEPAWTDNGDGTSRPIDWSQRDYLYDRTRVGAGWDLDYRFDPQNQIYVKGLYSHFQNFGTRYVYDVSVNGADSARNGTTGYGTGVVPTREVQWRAPIEQMWGLNIGGLHQFASSWGLDYSVNYTGTTQRDNDYRSTDFQPTSAPGLGSTVQYSFASHRFPTYTFTNPAEAAAVTDPAQYAFVGFGTDSNSTRGSNWGGKIDLLKSFQMGQNLNELKFGVLYRLQNKVYQQNSPQYNAGGAPYLLTSAPSGFSDPNFYSKQLAGAYTIGAQPDYGVTKAWEDANLGSLVNATDYLGDTAAYFSGDEKILSGYVMDNYYLGNLLVNVGLRVEQTKVDYHAYALVSDTLGNTTANPVSGGTTYVDWFPSLQLRYQTDEQLSFRLAITRGISRPNYSDIAPTLSGTVNPILINDYTNVSTGNPALKAQTSWNYDLLVAKYFKNVGVLSGGLFYKDIADFIFTKDFRYNGPYAPLVGYAGTTPMNGQSGHLEGFEIEWVQTFSFLPGFAKGFGVDLNWTHSSSSAVVPCNSPGVGGCAVSGSDTTRGAALPRESPNIANASLIYNGGPISARVAWTYNDYSIYGYGDGSNSGSSGDTYFYPHSQFDASLMWDVSRSIQLQFQVLNITNEVFGFYTGTVSDHYNIQREYYGATFFLGVRYGFIGY